MSEDRILKLRPRFVRFDAVLWDGSDEALAAMNELGGQDFGFERDEDDKNRLRTTMPWLRSYISKGMYLVVNLRRGEFAMMRREELLEQFAEVFSETG